MSEQAVRYFTFRTEFTGTYGDTVTLKTIYKVLFKRYPDSRFTYVTVEPEFAPNKRLKIIDCGITWKSFFFAFMWCSGDSEGHIKEWVKMSLLQDEDPEHVENGGDCVIPDIDLSTTPVVQTGV